MYNKKFCDPIKIWRESGFSLLICRNLQFDGGGDNDVVACLVFPWFEFEVEEVFDLYKILIYKKKLNFFASDEDDAEYKSCLSFFKQKTKRYLLAKVQKPYRHFFFPFAHSFFFSSTISVSFHFHRFHYRQWLFVSVIVDRIHTVCSYYYKHRSIYSLCAYSNKLQKSMAFSQLIKYWIYLYSQRYCFLTYICMLSLPPPKKKQTNKHFRFGRFFFMVPLKLCNE